MCGIAGYGVEDGPAHSGISAARGGLSHRGLNDQGPHVHSPVSMGMARISIIDVEGRHQCTCNEDSTTPVLFNGEIYKCRAPARQLGRQGRTFAKSGDSEVLDEQHATLMLELWLRREEEVVA